MAAEQGDFDEEVYDEVEYDDDEEYDVEEEDGIIEEVEVEEDEDDEGEIGAEGDDEEEQGAAGGPGGQGQMLYIPGLGYIPLSSLNNIPGLRQGPPGVAAVAAAPPPETEREWTGLSEMPPVTQECITDMFATLNEDGKAELTVLVLGRGGAGKSSTVNSLLNERVANVFAFQQDNAKPTMYSRRTPDDFVFHIIDTPSLLEQDAFAPGRLQSIGAALADREIDVVLYVDRLDNYAVDALDKAVISGVTQVLGAEVWNNVVLCLTRSSESSAPPGVDFEEHVAAREADLKAAILAGGAATSDVAVALVENSSQCPRNEEGEKVVPGDAPWLADLMEKIVDVALNVGPFEYQPEKAAKAADPNRRRKWLIPLVVAAQVLVKLLLDRVMDEDGCRGDSNGPFDAQTVKERRAELKEERRRAAKRQQKSRAFSKAAAESSFLSSSFIDDLDEDEDEEDF